MAKIIINLEYSGDLTVTKLSVFNEVSVSFTKLWLKWGSITPKMVVLIPNIN
jgi:hypothetical protein